MLSVPPEVFVLGGIAVVVSLIAIYAARTKDLSWFLLVLVVLWFLGAPTLAQYSPSHRNSFWFDAAFYAGMLLIPATIYAVVLGMLVKRKVGAIAIISMTTGATVVGYFLCLIAGLYVACYVFNDCP